MPPSRTFSFGNDDERALSSNREERLQHTHTQHYQDSPARNIISPPPAYGVPELQQTPITTPTRPLLAESTTLRGSPERTVSRYREPYSDETPPAPPPHRTSPSRAQRHSIARRPVAAVPVDDYEEDTGIHPSHYAPQERYNQERNSEQPSPNMHPDYHVDDPYASSPYRQRPSSYLPDNRSYSSNIPLAAGAATPGSMTPVGTPHAQSIRHSGVSIPLEDYSNSRGNYNTGYYHDSPYHNSSHNLDATISDASINPHDIADDGDDGFIPDPKRRSVLQRSKSRRAAAAAATGGAGAAAASAGLLGSAFGPKNNVRDSNTAYDAADGYNQPEKSTWLAKQKTGKKKMRWILGAVIGLVIVVAIAAGIVGGVLGTRRSDSDSSGGGGGNINNAADDFNTNGDLNINSAEIKKLMKNPNLHKVFPGMDYTPWGVQYPLCMTYPPSQNNVTRDMAVLSQLTNTVRLYGTDCNQTEMVLHAIDRLQLKNMKVWLGVWVDTNATTTERQIAHMYKILEEVTDRSIFKGVIVGNEALYRAGEAKEQSKQELVTLLTGVKSNFTRLNYDLPVATSDLGDNWTADLVQVSDFVMSNIHPFFAGVPAEQGAAWTWSFWQRVDAPLTPSDPSRQVISETGWPSGGGTDCGGTDGKCAQGQTGAVASVDGMNKFMADWVCQAMANGTDYFWFEAFDEPWKVQFNTADQAWEDKWGLMDQARKLKPGIKIPDCGGKTVG